MKYLALFASVFIFTTPAFIQSVPLKKTASMLATAGYLGYVAWPYVRIMNNKYVPFSSTHNRVTVEDLSFGLARRVKRHAKKMGIEAEGAFCDSIPSSSPGGAGVATDGTNFVLLDKKRFMRMSPQEEDFAIGHELAHLKHNDHINRSKLDRALLCGVAVCELVLCVNILPHMRNWNNSFLLWPVIPFLLRGLTNQAYRRRQEYAADAAAVRLLKSAKGGISVLKSLSFYAPDAPTKFVDFCLGCIGGWLLSEQVLSKYSNQLKNSSAGALQFSCAVLCGLIGVSGNMLQSLCEAPFDHPLSHKRVARMEKLAQELGY